MKTFTETAHNIPNIKKPRDIYKFTDGSLIQFNRGSFDDYRNNPSHRLDCPGSHPTSPKPTLFHGCDQQYRKTRLLAEQSLGKSFNSLD